MPSGTVPILRRSRGAGPSEIACEVHPSATAKMYLYLPTDSVRYGLPCISFSAHEACAKDPAIVRGIVQAPADNLVKVYQELCQPRLSSSLV